MDRIKIENFEREHPTKEFPRYRSLSSRDANKIHKTWFLKMAQSDGNPLELIKEIRARSRRLNCPRAESEEFSLEDCFAKADIHSRPDVFVNWDQFNAIDRLDLHDLNRYFLDLWYPAADDIDIFDSSFQWILSIDYLGIVTLLKL
jgi:hypothetical protein